MVAVITLVLVMVAVAFFTLMERKVLGYIHIRKGPNKPGPAGLLVPFADAVKIFLKEMSYPLLSNKTLFNTIAILIMLVPMILWFVNPIESFHTDPKVMCIFVVAIASIGVYGTLGAGWSSNSKYSLLGALRAVAQTISYEVSMTIIILTSVIFFFYDMTQEKSVSIWGWNFLITMMFAVSVLAEANRSPFDFAEGESELVSGFNTEYSSVLFVMVFLAEYMSILFMSFLCSMLFLASSIVELFAGGITISFFYIWARGTLPRFRYDQLMYLAWKVFLPMSLFILVLKTTMFSMWELWKLMWSKLSIFFSSMYVMIAWLISSIFLVGSILSLKTLSDKEKMSPFECGFEPYGVSRLPFCMKFFLVSIIFLVFDVEVTLILPMIFSSYQVMTFLIILIMGLFYEWMFGGLHWMV
uniref:Multifunctional fusion protein n=1 Tax=Parasagitta setosa TaxID=366441 RepID=A0A141CKT1_9BILA|nr:NADH dehydrogenase subunit 1 [Parasagitta setosa]